MAYCHCDIREDVSTEQKFVGLAKQTTERSHSDIDVFSSDDPIKDLISKILKATRE